MPIDAHEKPPEVLRASFKKHQKLPLAAVESDPNIVDFKRGLLPHQQNAFTSSQFANENLLRSTLESFLKTGNDLKISLERAQPCFHARDLPGLTVVPGLLPTEVQNTLLSKVLHRDLSNPTHTTNVHFHHNIKYPDPDQSFFDLDPSCTSHFSPFDPSVHKSLSVRQFLDKKLRWMTLGGQYDWTEKKYPDTNPPYFPKDLQQLLHGLFPETTAQAAIVNLYSPGDVLSLHRDVSEYCDRGLISISVGCDGLFMLGLEKEDHVTSALRQAVIRVRSGDAIYMSGESRYAWHGVPTIIPDTCPDQLQPWPCHPMLGIHTKEHDRGQNYSEWHSWLAKKRINLNVRQMFDSENHPEEHDYPKNNQ